MNRSRTALFVIGFLTAMGATCHAAPRPNFLIIMADDCTYNDLPVYGGANARTPAIDALAKQGLVFNRAYLAEAMCQPCRAELYSGMYPIRNGCAWNHSLCRPAITTMPHRLGRLGYRVGLAGKVHVGPSKAIPFEEVTGFDSNCVRNPTSRHDLKGVAEFLAPRQNEPFCLVIALVEPHVPWVMGDPSKYPPDKIELPANISDTPQTRREFSRYLAEITYMDSQVADILKALDDSGQVENTLVLFTSEQGSQFPGCKWTNWDTGLHTALIARWPAHLPAGKRSDALVQYADVLPTLLAAAGGKPPTDAMDGMSFLPVLLGQRGDHRQYAYGMHNNVPEGPPYPIRTVCDGEFRYISNLAYTEIYLEKHLMGTGRLNNPYWATWLEAASRDRRTYNLVKRYMRRPAEELYHTALDPFEMKNLADNPRHAETKARLSAELDRWRKSQSDPGAAQDTLEAFEAARRGRHVDPRDDAR